MNRLISVVFISFAYCAFTAKPEDNNFFNTDTIIAQVSALVNTTPPPVTAKKMGMGYGVFQHGVNKKVPLSTLKGKTLRIEVPAIEPPYVNYVNFSSQAPKDKGYGPGVVIEILKEMAELLNLTYVVVDAGVRQWGSLENGSWTGGFGELYRGNVDLIAGATIMQYDRSLISDLTYPFQYEMTGMLVRSPDKFEDTTMLIVTAPFKWQVWVTTAGCIVVSAGVLLLISRSVSNVYSERTYGYGECVWVFYSIFIQQDIEGLVKVVKQGKYKILMDGNSRTRTEMIARSDLPVYKQLWHEMSVNHRVLYANGMDTAIEVLHNTSGYVLLGPWETLSYFAYIDCHFYLLGEGILPVYLSIPLQLNSPYSNFFSDRIRGMDERGFIKKWLSDYDNYVYSQKWEQCNTTTTSSKSYLDLKRAQGAFWVLLGGLGVAAILLLSEYIFKWVFHRIDLSRIMPIYFQKDHRSDNSSDVVSEPSVGSAGEDVRSMSDVAYHASDEKESNYEQISMVSIRHRNSQRSKLESQSSGEDFIEIDI